MCFEGFWTVCVVSKGVYGVWNPKTVTLTPPLCTVARGWSNLGATAHSATLHGASATDGPGVQHLHDDARLVPPCPVTRPTDLLKAGKSGQKVHHTLAFRML